MAARIDPRWYFSLRSPYSWFAYRELVERHPDVLPQLRWIPCWDPDEESERQLAAVGERLPLTAMTRAKSFYILQDARRWARLRGWTVTWPVDREPSWEVPHLAYLLAADAGLGPQFLDLAYRARWEQARDICARDTVGEIAAELGLDPERLATAADDPEVRLRSRECLREAVRDGVFGVPFLIHGRDKFWGAERVGAFVATLRGAPYAPGSDAPGYPDGDPAAVLGLLGDGGHAGGCG